MQKYEVLTRADLDNIHEATMQVLEKTGVRFKYKPALNVFSKEGLKIDGNKVYFNKEFIEKQIKKVPEKFTLHARNPENNVEIGGDNIVLTPGYGSPYVMDLENGRRMGSLEDYENFAKLAGASKYQDLTGGILVEPNDVQDKLRNAKMTYACIKNSDKCFMGSAYGEKGAKESIEMASILFGGRKELEENPALISILCSLTPLNYDDRMLGAVMEYAKAGQPQLISSLAIAGSTSPSTLAGTLVVQNAEVLAGIALTQLIREGTPVIYAAASSNTEMRYGSLCIGSPEMALLSNATAMLGRYYKIPSRSGGAITDSKIPDTQSGFESMMNLLMAKNSGISFVLHSAGIIESYNTICYEKFVIDDEICGMVKRVEKGIEVNKETLALELIDEVGSDGHYLDKIHTLNHYKDEFYLTKLCNRANYDQWKNSGSLEYMRAANKKYKEILKNYEPPKLPADIDRDLQKYIEKL